MHLAGRFDGRDKVRGATFCRHTRHTYMPDLMFDGLGQYGSLYSQSVLGNRDSSLRRHDQDSGICRCGAQTGVFETLG